ncbi:hypothetical protein LRR81_09935 [Metabacillus sp. GX 13764]|uniref:hypothetical protein n=1 Tax=Metabacillus kandeliae TaxID=2900151 RepID=UPI001E4C9D46|nr:hypothetical protein [Metabacillus kandeliae]MCD7034559.1 hypothetical protein [Metabacillus kandeliae]
MQTNILKIIQDLYQKPDYSYTLLNYVDRDYWKDKLLTNMKATHIDNLTDFNYSKCFTLFICSDYYPKINLGSDELSEYLKNHSFLDGIMLYISAIAPFAAIKFFRYKDIESNVQLIELPHPPLEESKTIYKQLISLLNENNLEILQGETLALKVNEISLELEEGELTVFQCLFEE